MSAPAEFVFTYPGRVGPVVKRFTSVFAFDGYVSFWRERVGPVEWVSPMLCKGSM